MKIAFLYFFLKNLFKEIKISKFYLNNKNIVLSHTYFTMIISAWWLQTSSRLSGRKSKKQPESS